MDIKKTLELLCRQPVVSGFEPGNTGQIAKLMGEVADEVSTDAFGNIIAVKRCGKADAPRLMIDAHIDRVGLIVSGHSGTFLAFKPVGGIDTRILPACRVTVCAKQPFGGVITSISPHLLDGDEQKNAFKMEDLYIDTGIEPEELKSLAPVGTTVMFDIEPFALGKNCFAASALDDMAGLCAGMLALERMGDSGFDIYLCASATEETGMAGAAVNANKIRPDCAIIVDVTHGKTTDAPADKTFELGSGVAIGLGPNMNKKITDRLVSLAAEHKIDHTFEVMEGNTGTNAWAVQVCGLGVPCGVLSIPLRYMHTPTEVLCVDDVEKTARLIELFAKTPLSS